MQLPWVWVSEGCGERRPGHAAPAGGQPQGLGRLGLDHLVEDELAAFDPVSAVVGQRRVAVLVDRVRAEHGLTVLDLVERVDDGLAVASLVTGVLDRLQGDAHRLVAVDRVGLGIRAVLGLVVLEELLAGRGVELRIEGRVGDEGLLLGLRPDLRRERGLRDAIRPEQLGRRQRRVEVLPQLHRVVLGDAAEEDAIGAGALDRPGQRAVVRGLGVDALVAEHRDALRLGERSHLIGEALPVDLLVVQDEQLRAAVVLLVGHLRRRLDVVGGDDAAVGALAGRVVLVRLALVGALGTGEAYARVGRRYLQDAGLVQDRQRDRRGAGVELTEVDDGRLVLRRLAGVAGRRARLPLAGRRRGVVQALVVDGVLAGLPAGLLEGHLLAVDDRDRLRPGVALQRQARVDGQACAARARARGSSSAAATVVVVVAAASGNSER